MRIIIVIAIFMTIFFGATVQASPLSYWFYLQDDGHTWCGYSDATAFQADVSKAKPTESARVTYSSNKLTEFTYQVEPESGDWIVVDKYTRANDQLFLKRANLLAQNDLQIVQETSISDGKAEPFHIVSVTTLDGKKADANLSNIDFPSVPIKTDLSKVPFLMVAAEMQKKEVVKSCKAF